VAKLREHGQVKFATATEVLVLEAVGKQLHLHCWLLKPVAKLSEQGKVKERTFIAGF